MSVIDKTTSVRRSMHLFREAKDYIPGGVNSPVRAYLAVGGVPRFIQSASGATITDVDGNTYIDYVDSWGPMILGHGHPAVINAVKDAVDRGLSFGAPCENEVRLAEKICSHVPSIEKIRFVNSGTEATMSAIRLARGATGREKIIKFEGGYHGHADSLLVKAGSGALTFGSPSSPGVTKGATNDTLVATFNDLDSVAALFESNRKQIAAVILEPIAANMNMVPPIPGFLKGLRDLCDTNDSLLIFDEVITGFRLGLGGAQAHFSVRPDLTTLGKIIGGGMPVGAFGGRKEIMAHLSPEGPVYQAGTLSGNPIAMAAGLATLTACESPHFYEPLFEKTKQLIEGILERARHAGIPLSANYVCGLFGLFFTANERVKNYADVMACDNERFKRFFHAMLDNGIYLAPSAFESGFISAAHGANEISMTLDAVERVFSNIRQ